MKSLFLYIGLITGILLIVASFYFFGRQHGTYTKMLWTGLLLSLTAFIVILFTEKGWKRKLTGTFVVVGGIVFQRATEPLLIRQSYSIFVNQHLGILEQTAILFSKKPAGLYDHVFDKQTKDPLTEKESALLNQMKKETGVRFISVTDKHVFFCLNGALDIYRGVYYSISEENNTAFKKIQPNWYF
jgi:hypothetical protein